MIALGVFIALVFKYFIEHGRTEHPFFHSLLAIVVVTILLWEANLWMDYLLNQYYPWLPNTRKRLLIQIAVSSGTTVLLLINCIIIAHAIIDTPTDRPKHKIDPLFFPGLFVAFAVLSIDIGSQFLRAWKQSVVELAEYKNQTTLTQLQHLKTQLNPHFLFNNLSVLTSLVYKNQDEAVAFINELSKVYRYTLETQSAELVTLKEELDFLYHYIYLLKMRFGSSLNFSFQVAKAAMDKRLPPMCLQLLVENAIQHNEASQAKPLTVTIQADETSLSISNPIQLRSDNTQGTRTGLQNIEARYAFFTGDKLLIATDELLFKVTLPLIVAS